MCREVPDKGETTKLTCENMAQERKEISEAKLTLYAIMAAVAYVVTDLVIMAQTGFNIM